MPHSHDEGYVALPAYAVPATSLHKLVLDDVNPKNRSTVVHAGVGPQEVPIRVPRRRHRNIRI